MKIAIYSVAGLAGFILLLVWCRFQIHYRIGSRHLKIVLFRIAIRKIPLEEICNATKRRPKGMAERWHNCLKGSHRLLTIEKTRGLRKFISITPRNRYVFLADLKNAVRRINPNADWVRRTGLEEPGMEETDETVTTSQGPRHF